MSRSLECDCSLPKRAGARCCDRCASLDGESTQDWLAIDTLRNLGGVATMDALRLEVGWSYRQAARAMQRLRQTGRVIRLETDMEHHRNCPTFLLSDAVVKPVRAWRQMALPRFRRWGASKIAAGSRCIIATRRRRHRRARGEQLAFPTEVEPHQAVAA